MKTTLCFIFFIAIFINGQTQTLSGVNITDFQKVTPPKKVKTKHLKKQLTLLKEKGITNVRIPFRFNTKNTEIDKKLLKKIVCISKFCDKKNIELVLVNFDEALNKENYLIKGGIITHKWIKLMRYLKKYQNVYYELLNEPQLYPNAWRNFVTQMIREIRIHYPHQKLVIGATNYNSIYELSRMEPLQFENLIYTFHFYEPFVFTHQGASWVQPQNATTGIPFPYAEKQMPKLHPNAKGTAGENNWRDYSKTGNEQSLRQKIGIIYHWSQKHHTKIWCTEYGVINKSNPQAKWNYLNAIQKVFNEYQIKNYAWELQGNFGLVANQQFHFLNLINQSSP